MDTKILSSPNPCIQWCTCIEPSLVITADPSIRCSVCAVGSNDLKSRQGDTGWDLYIGGFVTCLVALTKCQLSNPGREGGFILAPSPRRSFPSRRQELEAVGHIALAVRKQRERKLVLCLLLHGMVLPTGLVGLPTSSTQSR